MSMSEKAPFPGARGTRTGGILRSRTTWLLVTGGLIVTGGAMRIAGVGAGEVLNMGKEAAENNTEAVDDLRNAAANGISTDGEEISSGGETIDIEDALRGNTPDVDSGSETSSTETPSGTTGNASRGTLYSLLENCGVLPEYGDNYSAAYSDLQAANVGNAALSAGSWEDVNWSSLGTVNCP